MDEFVYFMANVIHACSVVPAVAAATVADATATATDAPATQNARSIEYVVVPKNEWDLLNRDLESMQHIVRIQSSELNALLSKDFQEFERIQEETVVNQVFMWMKDHKDIGDDFHLLKKHDAFARFIRHIQVGCEQARREYMERLLKKRGCGINNNV